MRTSGRPPISARSLFGPPMRVERPAARMTAAIAAALLRHRLRARLRPRDDLHQQPADAHAGDVGARHRQAGEQPHQHPVEAVFLGRARAARRAEHRTRRAPARSASGCRDRPACRNARCVRRPPRPPPGSRRAGRRWRRRRTPPPARRRPSAPRRAPWRAPPARAARGARRRCSAPAGASRSCGDLAASCRPPCRRGPAAASRPRRPS